MILIASDGGHPRPATVTSLLAAWVEGADILVVDVRADPQGEPVTAAGAGLAAVLEELPAEATVALRLHLDDGDDIDAVATRLEGVVTRAGAAARCVVATASFDALTAITALRRIYVASPEDSAERCVHAGAQGVLVAAEQVLDGDEASAFHATLAAEVASGEMALGLLVSVDGLDRDGLARVCALDAVECVLGVSAIALAAALRPRRVLASSTFKREDGDAGRLRFGAARSASALRVDVSDGLHVTVDPGGAEDVAGGVGMAFSVDGDFAAEIDFAGAPELRLALAALNVDPPDRGATLRVEGSFFDPEGAPPFVSVERDAGGGLRGCYNRGAHLDSCRRGGLAGDAHNAGSLRLTRRGLWFASYHRDAAGGDWGCISACRNDSINRSAYLRVVVAGRASGAVARLTVRELRVTVPLAGR